MEIHAIVVSVVFLLIQIATILICYRTNHKPLTVKLELAAISISLLSFIFFLLRAFPIWTNVSCELFHGAVMFLFELQLALYTGVQYLRFIRVLGMNLKWLEICMVLGFIVTISLSTYGQDGHVMNGMCDFAHNLPITIVIALIHIIAELSIVYFFTAYYEKLSKILGTNEQITFLMKRMQILMIVFTLWLICISVINIAQDMAVMVVMYNWHFTFVPIILGMPHLYKTMKTPTQSSQKKSGAVATGIVASSSISANMTASAGIVPSGSVNSNLTVNSTLIPSNSVGSHLSAHV